VAQHQRRQLLARPVRRVHQPGEHRELVGERRRNVAEMPQHIPGRREGVGDEAAGDHGPDRVQAVLEGGHHAEVAAAAAAQRPEQVRLLLDAGP
jgi:hypothetical protein